ncbi:MAG: hypothetical protein ACE5G5_01835, partial [Candidatus Methylomirabilales bacterium]
AEGCQKGEANESCYKSSHGFTSVEEREDLGTEPKGSRLRRRVVPIPVMMFLGSRMVSVG